MARSRRWPVMHLFLNALGASAGSGLTYLYNVVPQLSARADLRTTLAVQPYLQRQFADFSNLTCLPMGQSLNTARRFWFEQTELPMMVRNSAADVLISAGNFAVRRSPIPQILLSGNSLYTSPAFYRDLVKRRAYRIWLDTRIKGVLGRKSIHWADFTVAPTRAYADELTNWTKKDVVAIHHGFDRETFFQTESAPSLELQKKLQFQPQNAVRLLFVSHYNYYRNFETLLRVIPLLRTKLQGRAVRLFLTCKLEEGANPGSYDPSPTARFIQKLGIREEVVELGAIPYHLLNHVYRACDVYITPAYTETFAHPLVEAMACGLPIVASDLAVHREVCEDAAVYFPSFSPDLLAEAVARVVLTPAFAENLSRLGQQRSSHFSWKNHVEKLLSLAYVLTARSRNEVVEAA
jgi:glycosyltransferase involved in cell wall biosynthesis